MSQSSKRSVSLDCQQPVNLHPSGHLMPFCLLICLSTSQTPTQSLPNLLLKGHFAIFCMKRHVGQVQRLLHQCAQPGPPADFLHM